MFKILFKSLLLAFVAYSNSNALHKPKPLLHKAIITGKIKVVRELLEGGASVEEVDWQGRTALHCAAQFGTPDIAALLLSRGARVDAPDNDGSTPLLVSAQWAQYRMVAFLVAQGADTQQVNGGGFTPSYWATVNEDIESLAVLTGTIHVPGQVEIDQG